jgi:hypothetical protein
VSKHNFTPEDLVQYLYNETSPEKSSAIKAALEIDWSLREMYNVIVSGQKRLEAFELSPREEALNKILNYAEKSISELHHH